jgi:hypothetical protein
MHMRRVFAVLAVVAAGSLGVVSPAVAGPYGPHTGSATVSETQVEQGDSVQISGDEFCRRARVVFSATQGGDTYISGTIRTNRRGVASTEVTLTELGVNRLRLTGCWQGGGSQVLSAEVNVVPHTTALEVSDHTVNRGDRVDVSGSGFCRNTDVVVRVFDDGDRYQVKTIQSDRRGDADTSVRLTRAGRNTITFQGCSEGGGDILESATVRVRDHHSFRSAPVAYAGDLAGSLSPAGSALAGGGLLLVLFGAVQVLVARRHRSS